MSYVVPTKAMKMTIPINLADFPVSAIPPPGTPGGKGVVVEVLVQTPDGASLTASLKGSGLQKLLAAINAAPQGGFVVLQGKLGAGNVLAEAGCVFQPNKIATEVQLTGQMPELQRP